MTAASTLLTDDDRADIQGFITSGYGHLPVAAYLFVRLHDAARATHMDSNPRTHDLIVPALAGRGKR